jgi:sigma-E factor negative regulatory protein RseB
VKRVFPLLAVAATIGLAPAARASDGPLDEARVAMAEATFTGVVAVAWRDGTAMRRTSVVVRADQGDIEFDGPVPIVKTFGAHFVRMAGGWSDLGPGLDVGQPTTDKYTVRRGEGPVVAGRPTASLEVLDGETLRERMAIDRENGVVLRREQLDDRGRVMRRIEFTSFEPGPPARHRETPPRYRPEHASALAAVPAPYRAPTTLDGDYQRVGVYRRDSVVQVVYGDGVYGLSVFEEPGHLNWAALPPAGRAVTVAGHRARSYAWPGGQLVTWEAGGSTFTAVGDGPVGEIVAAAASIRGARSLSTVQRLRQTARELVETLSGRGSPRR